MIVHEHLKTAVEDHYSSDDKEVLLRLANELRYSNLFIPARRHDGKLSYDIYDNEGMKLTPLFTDLDEVEKFYKSDDIEVFSNSFELYRNILKTTDIDGYILNPASQKYLFKRQFVLAITDIPKTTYVTSNPYSPEELRDLCDCENRELEDFISSGANIGNYEALFEKLSKSTVLTLMLSQNDLGDFLRGGMLNMQLTGPVASMHVDNVGGRYACIFSTKGKMKHVKTPLHKYAQVVNLSMLVNFVLTEDMDGIILNPSSDDILIPRPTLLNYSLGFEKYADDERLADSMYWIFEI